MNSPAGAGGAFLRATTILLAEVRQGMYKERNCFVEACEVPFPEYTEKSR